MDHHLDCDEETGNRRNGYGKKTVTTDSCSFEVDILRDREARFDPQLIAKYQRRFPGFDDKVVSIYARGMSMREIVGHLRELCGIDVSPDLASTVTDAVLEEVAAWQGRPLDAVYPLVFFDALRVKIRDEGLVRNKAVHIALGVRADGAKEILGLWIEQNEGAKPALGLDPWVLAAGHERTEEPRRGGPPACCRRWAEGLPRGDYCRLPRSHGPVVHRSSAASQHRLCLL